MMFIGHRQKFARVILIVLMCGTLTPLALAQDENPLRRENELLKQQVEDLTAQLDQARSQIADLERQVQQLSDALERAGRSTTELPPPAPEGEVTIDESKPDASPRALFAALKGEYEDVTADLEMGKSGDAARITYHRTVERWINTANRKHKTKIDWYVKFFERPLSPNPDRLKLLAVDPVTHTVLGEPFFVPVTRPLARQLNRIESRDELKVFVLKGVLTPRLSFNENAVRPNPFNPSQFLGPFVEFNYTIEPMNVLPAKELDEGEDAG